MSRHEMSGEASLRAGAKSCVMYREPERGSEYLHNEVAPER